MIAGDVVEDPRGEWRGMPDCKNRDERPFRSLRVHFASSEDVDDFANLIGQRFSGTAKYIWHPRMKMERPSATPYVDKS